MTLKTIVEACKWTTKQHPDGSREFFDGDGKRRCRFANDDVMAIHVMFANEECDTLRAKVKRLLAAAKAAGGER